ncbi:MAG: hypothetical protein ACE5F1_20205 [Planctomycetota bacterium]
MGSFSPVRHGSRSPDVAGLLEILEDRKVRFILIGSVAAAAYGVELEAGDLDIVPDTDEANLRALVYALRDMEAEPLGPFGDWTVLESGEKKWIPRPTTEQDLAEWMPDVEALWTLDHLYVTRLGNFDVVPEIAGTYDTLRARACLRSCEGIDVWVAHIDELLARLTVPRREKDIPRVAALREIQRSHGTETDRS